MVAATEDCTFIAESYNNYLSVENEASECTVTSNGHTYEAAEFNDKTDPNKELQYNTLQHEGAANIVTVTGVDLSLGLYNTIRETQVNTEYDEHSLAAIHAHEQYDEVATFSDKESDRCHRKQENKTAYEMTALDYETVCLAPNEDQKSKEVAGDNKLFDDDLYSTTQSGFTKISAGIQMEDQHTTQPTPEQVYSEIKDKNVLSLLHNTSNEHEYAEPQAFNNRVRGNTESQSTCTAHVHIGGHYYHSLEGNDKGIKAVSSTCVNGGGSHKELHTKHVENAVLDHTYDSPDTFKKLPNQEEENTTHLKSPSLLLHQNQSLNELSTEENKYHTLTPPTTLSHSNQSLNEIGTATAPTLFNIEHRQFDDPLYEGVPQHSDTLQECNDVKVDTIFDDPTYA